MVGILWLLQRGSSARQHCGLSVSEGVRVLNQDDSFFPRLAQSRQQQQNVEDAMKEMQKPLARYIDDEDLDRMLREQEREGDPMANFIKKNKAKENKNKKGETWGCWSLR